RGRLGQGAARRDGIPRRVVGLRRRGGGATGRRAAGLAEGDGLVVGGPRRGERAGLRTDRHRLVVALRRAADVGVLRLVLAAGGGDRLAEGAGVERAGERFGVGRAVEAGRGQRVVVVDGAGGEVGEGARPQLEVHGGGVDRAVVVAELGRRPAAG